MDEGEVEVEVEGVLAKLKHKPTPFTSPWNNRYFDVRRLKGRNQPLALTYRESRKSKNIKGWIYLSEVQSVRKVSSVDNCMVGPTASVQPHSKLISAIGDHEGRVFEIQALSRLFIVRAVDRHVDEWVEPLQRLCLQARDEDGVEGSVGADTSAGHVLRTGKTVRRVNTGSSLRAGTGAGSGGGGGDGVPRRRSGPIQVEEGSTWDEEDEEEDEEHEEEDRLAASRESGRRGAPSKPSRRTHRAAARRPAPRRVRRRSRSRSGSRSPSRSGPDSPRSDLVSPPSSRGSERSSGHARRRRRQRRGQGRRSSRDASSDSASEGGRRPRGRGLQGSKGRAEGEEEEEEEEEGGERRHSAPRAGDASRGEGERERGGRRGEADVERAPRGSARPQAQAQARAGSRDRSDGAGRGAAREGGKQVSGLPAAWSNRLVTQGAVREGWRTSGAAGEEEGVRKGPRRPSPTPTAVRPSLGTGRRTRAVAPSVVHAEKSLEDEFSDDEVDVLQEMLQEEDTQAAAAPVSASATRAGSLESGRWGDDSLSDEEGGAAEESRQEERRRVVDEALAEERSSPQRATRGEEGKTGEAEAPKAGSRGSELDGGGADDDDDDWDKEMESDSEPECGGEEKGAGPAPARDGARGKLDAGVRVDEDFVTADWDDEDDEEE